MGWEFVLGRRGLFCCVCLKPLFIFFSRGRPGYSTSPARRDFYSRGGSRGGLPAAPGFRRHSASRRLQCPKESVTRHFFTTTTRFLLSMPDLPREICLSEVVAKYTCFWGGGRREEEKVKDFFSWLEYHKRVGVEVLHSSGQNARTRGEAEEVRLCGHDQRNGVDREPCHVQGRLRPPHPSSPTHPTQQCMHPRENPASAGICQRKQMTSFKVTRDPPPRATREATRRPAGERGG